MDYSLLMAIRKVGEPKKFKKMSMSLSMNQENLN